MDLRAGIRTVNFACTEGSREANYKLWVRILGLFIFFFVKNDFLHFPERSAWLTWFQKKSYVDVNPTVQCRCHHRTKATMRLDISRESNICRKPATEVVRPTPTATCSWKNTIDCRSFSPKALRPRSSTVSRLLTAMLTVHAKSSFTAKSRVRVSTTHRATSPGLTRRSTRRSWKIASSNGEGFPSFLANKRLNRRLNCSYSYIDQSETAREHRPVIPKVEPKKLVRYRDNKIVSLRGERYTESRDDADGEPRKPKKVLP